MAMKPTQDRGDKLLARAKQINRDADTAAARRAEKSASDRALADAQEEGRVAAAKAAMNAREIEDINKLNRDFWAEHQRRMQEGR